MAAFNYQTYNDASVDQNSYIHRTYPIDGPPGSSATDAGTITSKVPLGLGPIPWVTRYSPSGSVAHLYIQTDRVLVTSAALTTTTNYTLVGTSAPTVTAVSFTTGKSYIRLTLSSTIDRTYNYSLKVEPGTFSDIVGLNFNTSITIPIVIDNSAISVGITETIDIGTPVVS